MIILWGFDRGARGARSEEEGGRDGGSEGVKEGEGIIRESKMAFLAGDVGLLNEIAR